MRKEAVLTVVVALCLVPLPLGAESVPASFQAAIIVKALAYDRALKERAGPAVNVGIIFVASDKADARLASEVREAFEALQTPVIQGLPLKVAEHGYKDAGTLSEWVAAEGIDVLYLTPGMGGELAKIKGVAQKGKTRTVTAERSLVEGGVALGVVLGPDKRPRILVNLAAAEGLGMTLDSKLLQLAEVIR